MISRAVRSREICAKNRLAPFETPAALVGEDRILVQVVRNMVGQMYSMHLDGTDAREFTRAAEGMPYGFSLSPDGRRVAFHLSSSQGYQVWTCDLDGKHRVLVAAKPGHLYFGTSWSPDGKWILYVDCVPQKNPGHDWADVCVGRADGTEHRVLTTGGAMWFAATYGDPKTRGGGSNVPAWTPDGKILFPRALPNSRVAWEFQPNRPDVDHFNRDFKPETGPWWDRNLPPRSLQRPRDPPDAQRAAGLGLPLERIARWSTDRVLQSGDRQPARDLGDGCRRCESASAHARPGKPRRRPSAMVTAIKRIGARLQSADPAAARERGRRRTGPPPGRG